MKIIIFFCKDIHPPFPHLISISSSNWGNSLTSPPFTFFRSKGRVGTTSRFRSFSTTFTQKFQDKSPLFSWCWVTMVSYGIASTNIYFVFSFFFHLLFLSEADRLSVYFLSAFYFYTITNLSLVYCIEYIHTDFIPHLSLLLSLYHVFPLS